MANVSVLNPLGYLINRQYNESVVIKNKLFKERLANARNLYRRDLLAHYGCVNAIEFSKEGELLVSGGDDRRVLLWSIPKAIHNIGSPVVLQTNHLSNIFCLAFNSANSRIFSGGNDDAVIVHDSSTGGLIVNLKHKNPVYGISVDPLNDNLLATAGDDGRILLFDLRESPTNDALCLVKEKAGFHSVMFNPINPRWLVTANSEKGIALWDCRKPKEVFVHYDQDAGETSGISACFNSDGSRILGLRRRLPPVLYATEKSSAICQFYHPQYYNSCTMKTCCFAGENDEYILSGSDDFNLYMWKIPREGSEWGISHIVLKDHRSIVNQVRYNKHSNLIASSGVEKMIKLWSTVPVGSWRGSLLKDHSAKARLVYSHDDYISLVGQSGERISHDYSDQSTMEDAKMMAFFDSLIQREIEGWDSSSENVMSSDSDCDQEQLLSVLTSSMFSTSKLPSEDLKRHRPNRIAQLIAQKRKKLIKMAHDKSTLLRHKLKEKQHRKKKGVHKHKSSSSSSKSGPSKNAGPSSKKLTVSKSPPAIESRESRAKHKAVPDRSRLRKYRTRQSLKDLSDSAASSNSLDAPSTSTGITSSSSSIFRIIEQDSDEDILPNSGNCVVEDNNNSSEPENFVSILPTPLNGTHDMYINVLEMNSDLNNGGNVVTVRNDDVSNYERASTSNGGLHVINGGSSSGSSGGAGNVFEDSSCGTNGFVQTLNTFDNNVKDDDDDNTDSDSDDSDDYGWEYVTPVKKRRTISASDSGCWTGPSSMSPYLTRASKNHQACSSGSGLNDNGSNGIEYEKFKKRVKKAKVNMRKQFGLDSDSN